MIVRPHKCVRWLLVALALGSGATACSTTAEPTTAEPSPATTSHKLVGPPEGPQGVHVIQQPKGLPVRMLRVTSAGTWTCENCGGDGKESTGSLTAEQAGRLQALISDPAFVQESDKARYPQRPCRFKMVSRLYIGPFGATVSDCPDQQPTPIAQQIVHLLADATPLEATLDKPVPA